MSLAPALVAALAVWMWPGRGDLASRDRSAGMPTPGAHFGQPSAPRNGSAVAVRGRAAIVWLMHPRGGAVDPEVGTAGVLSMLEALAPALEAGLPPGAALASAVEAMASGGMRSPDTADAGPATGGSESLVTPGVLGEVVMQAGRGSAMGPVWQSAAVTYSSSDLQLLGSAWSLSDSSGAPLADAVRTVARVLRAAMAHERQVQSAVAGARATMNLLTVLPLGGPLVALALGIGPRDLYSGPAAGVSLAAGVLLSLAGRWWVRRLVAAVAQGPVVL